jgi:phenylalanyl-tRNA synthetase alpha subunit
MHLANLEMAIFCKKELTKRKSFGMEMVFQKAQSSVSCFREYGGELKLSEGMVLEIIDEMDLLEKEIVSLKNEIKKDVNDKKEELLNNFKNSTKSEEEKKLKKEIDKLEKLNEEKKKKFQEEIEKINTKKDDEIFLLKQEIEGLKNKLKNDNQQWLQNLKELTITEQMEDHQSITSSTEIISDFE